MIYVNVKKNNNMKMITYLCFIILSLTSCSGSSQKVSQKKSHEIEIGCSSYPEMNKVLVIPENTMPTTISLPISLGTYLKFSSEYPSYQPANYLISFLKTIEFDGSEYQCHILPFSNKNILPILLWICRGDNEYYLVVTVDVNQGRVIDHLSVGKSTDNDVISFYINGDFNISQYQAQIVYNESNNAYDVVDKQMLNNYQIAVDGKIIKESISNANKQRSD